MQLNDQQKAVMPAKESPSIGGAILLAALALPGVSGVAHAEAPPDQGTIDVKYLDYRDWQPNLDRVTVHATAVDIMTPVAGDWSVQGSFVSDSVSGATPAFHTAGISGATNFEDHRKAEQVNVTRYFTWGTLNGGAAFSDENDFKSRALSFGGSFETESKNTTFNYGAAVENDLVYPVPEPHLPPVFPRPIEAPEHKVQLLFGVTQVLTPRDVVQLDFTHVADQGYLSSPYKAFDNRPDERAENIAEVRWNHHFDATDGTLRTSYRYYTDTFAIRSHTLDLAYVQPFSDGWTVTPTVRFYTQSAAFFYVNPVYSPIYGPPVPAGFVFGSQPYVSEDQRLSAFGAYTLGVKLEKKFAHDLRVNLKVEQYEQRGSWTTFGSGSPGLLPFYARIIEVGLSKAF